MNDRIYGPYADKLPEVLRIVTEAVKACGDEAAAERGGERPYEHCEGRIKTGESMLGKLSRRGLEENTLNALTRVYDAVGVRVVCRFIDDVYLMADLLQRRQGMRAVESKDYILRAKENGYRSYHLILRVDTPFPGPVEGKAYYAEVQLRTIAMDTWAALEHEISYKRDIPEREMIRAELKRCADELAACDVSMQAIRDMIREGGERKAEGEDTDRRGRG